MCRKQRTLAHIQRLVDTAAHAAWYLKSGTSDRGELQAAWAALPAAYDLPAPLRPRTPLPQAKACAQHPVLHPSHPSHSQHPPPRPNPNPYNNRHLSGTYGKGRPSGGANSH